MKPEVQRLSAKWVGSVRSSFAGRDLVVARSGGLSFETMVLGCSTPRDIYSSDSDFYPCMLGRFVQGKAIDYTIIHEEFAFLAKYMSDDLQRMALATVLPNVLKYRSRNNPHIERLWRNALAALPEAVVDAMASLEEFKPPIASFFDGKPLDHWMEHADKDAIFVCYGSEYSGKRDHFRLMDDLVDWDDPEAPPFGGTQQDKMLEFLRDSGHDYVWFDAVERPSLELASVDRRSLRDATAWTSTKYIYSNLKAGKRFFGGVTAPADFPTLPIAGADLDITPDSQLLVWPISNEQMKVYKSAYLGAKIQPTQASWPFVVMVDGAVVGFFDILNRMSPMYQALIKRFPSYLYLNGDFCVPGTKYKRLSKLVISAILSADTRRFVERSLEMRTDGLITTAFTERPVSMKYRGVFELVKRGETSDKRKFLNYAGAYTDRTWQQVLQAWLEKYGERQ